MSSNTYINLASGVMLLFLGSFVHCSPAQVPAKEPVPEEKAVVRDAGLEKSNRELQFETHDETHDTEPVVEPQMEQTREVARCAPNATRACTLSGVGECSKGFQTCQKEATWGKCIANGALGEELCDNKDNDCDGQVDEGCCANCCAPTKKFVDQKHDPFSPFLQFFGAISNDLKLHATRSTEKFWIKQFPTGSWFFFPTKDIWEQWEKSAPRVFRPMVFHPTKPELLAVGIDFDDGKDANVLFVDIKSKKRARIFSGHQKEAGETYGVTSLSFSRDGSLLAASFAGKHPRQTWPAVNGRNQIMIWQTSNSQIVRRIDTQHDAISAIALSPDGSLVAAGTNQSNTVRVWRVKDGKLLFTFANGENTDWRGKEHAVRVVKIIITKDSKRLFASSSNRAFVWVWSLSDGKLLKKFRAPIKGVCFRCPTNIGLSPDGNWLVGQVSHIGLFLWETKNFSINTTYYNESVSSLYDGPDTNVFWSSDSRAFVAFGLGSIRGFQCP